MVIYPNVAAMGQANLNRTALAASKLHLFKAITNPMSVNTVLADFTECDYDGYAEKTITAWLAAYLDPAGGASIQSGTQQFDYGPVGSPPVTNTVFGIYLVLAGGALAACGTFDAPIPMAAIGDSIPTSLTLRFGKS